MQDETPNVTRGARPETEVHLLKREPDPYLLCRLVILEGKTFKASALEAGYAESTACSGMKNLMANSALFTQVVRETWDKINASLDSLKPLAVTRLTREIADPESSAGMKAIELAGRFKETDWFVRSSETNIGVFTAIIEQTISEPTKDYKE